MISVILLRCAAILLVSIGILWLANPFTDKHVQLSKEKKNTSKIELAVTSIGKPKVTENNEQVDAMVNYEGLIGALMNEYPSSEALYFALSDIFDSLVNKDQSLHISQMR